MSLTSPSQIYPYSFLTSPAPKLRSGMIKHLCIAVEFKTSTYCSPHMSILNLRLASKILSPHSAPNLLITPHCICAFEYVNPIHYIGARPCVIHLCSSPITLSAHPKRYFIGSICSANDFSKSVSGTISGLPKTTLRFRDLLKGLRKLGT